ncbi:hypothetical protein NA57DRAFT_76462 [Rhizodiscina lignyota]|uniref:Uncharacterized protein n=1 Tax=Rhizodiscina lignyota TaxID=1504668 RepID=A0A9P4IGJ7_9PEZI|nr:hypothetical protein NA57DRAFT_76462 [Rhizodiscina lignyota]
MPSERRYFIPEEPLPASEISKLLGAVVANKLLPLKSSAPNTASGSDEPLHNAVDIIPDLLPDPVVWLDRKDFLSRTSGWTVRGGLSSLIGIGYSHTTENGIIIESEELKCYSLANSAEHFETLMKNELFARDVRNFLQRTRRTRAYFVAGFLTTKGTQWKEFNVYSRKSGVNVTVPVLEAVGSPLPGLADPQFAPSIKKSVRSEQSKRTEDELVFAVAYNVIKISRAFKVVRDNSIYLKRALINVGPKRATAKHLAFSGDDSENEDIIDSDEEGFDNSSDAQDAMEIVYMGGTKELSSEDLLEDGEAAVPSFSLQLQ